MRINQAQIFISRRQLKLSQSWLDSPSLSKKFHLRHSGAREANRQSPLVFGCSDAGNKGDLGVACYRKVKGTEDCVEA